jgi:Family of unknown function (DUF6011)
MSRPIPAVPTDAHQFTVAPHEPLTAEDRHEQRVLDEAAKLGYRLSVPCLECGHPLTSAASLARHVGPRCAARAKAVAS